ncbi:hypothetical protein [Entomomonas asaccharolytica]|uniref:Uncharacterized protein n=1 Tax=Entomomonas asaccharolytica TaxID=2785331 RepID=A0A974RW63_9GAMM|nr:hypothetical protein [Entomomonas asaccharolytica]QQP84772.1 hypothetical protein JHT90_10185 [Entomomonas asaccharolytica]
MANFFSKIVISLTFVFWVINSSATTLEEQFEGLLHCDQMGKLKGIYFDQYSQEVNLSRTPYFIERKLRPCELDSLATYCIDDTYYGLAVEKVSIPHNMSIYAIYFKDDVETVKKQLSNYMEIINFDPNVKSPKYPSLIPNQNDHKKSILFCDFYDE